MQTPKEYKKNIEKQIITSEMIKECLYSYYLFYQLNNTSYHTPINESEIDTYLKKYNINIIEINKLNTSGTEIDNLISVQFVDKVLNLIDSGEFKFENNFPKKNNILEENQKIVPFKFEFYDYDEVCWTEIKYLFHNDIKDFLNNIKVNQEKIVIDNFEDIEKREKKRIKDIMLKNKKRAQKRKFPIDLTPSKYNEKIKIKVKNNDKLKECCDKLRELKYISIEEFKEIFLKNNYDDLKAAKIQSLKNIKINKYIEKNFSDWVDEVREEIIKENL